MKSSFYLIGPRVGEGITYFSVFDGWVEDDTEATGFSRDILTVAPPPGTESIMELSAEGKPLNTFLPMEGAIKHSYFSLTTLQKFVE